MILHDKVLFKSGVVVETKVWQITDDDRYPDGLKYSLFAVYEGQTLVGYDSHLPKGHHRHIGEKEEPYRFTSLETLRNDFKADLEVELAKSGLS